MMSTYCSYSVECTRVCVCVCVQVLSSAYSVYSSSSVYDKPNWLSITCSLAR